MRTSRSSHLTAPPVGRIGASSCRTALHPDGQAPLLSPGRDFRRKISSQWRRPASISPSQEPQGSIMADFPLLEALLSRPMSGSTPLGRVPMAKTGRFSGENPVPMAPGRRRRPGRPLLVAIVTRFFSGNPATMAKGGVPRHHPDTPNRHCRSTRKKKSRAYGHCDAIFSDGPSQLPETVDHNQAICGGIPSSRAEP